MFRKLTLALVAAASLSARRWLPPRLPPAAADKGWHHHRHHHHHHGHGFGIGLIGGGYGGDDGCYQTRRVWTQFGYRFRVVNVCAW